MIDAVLAVGKDCDCGHPLIWRERVQVCAVYGHHPDLGDRVSFRDQTAAGARLVDEISAMHGNASHLERIRADRYLQAVV